MMKTLIVGWMCVLGILAGQTSRAAPWSQLNGFYDNAKGSPLLPLIESAKKQIDIEIYEMSDSNFFLALKAALKRGVQLRIIQDGTPYRSPCKVFEEKTNADSENCIKAKTFLKEVKQAGGTYLPFNKSALCGSGRIETTKCFEHGKLVLVDQKVALVSTGNFNPTNLCDLPEKPSVCNRDYSYVLRTPKAVEALQTIFSKDLLEKSYDLRAILNRGQVDQLITVSPFSKEYLLKLIASAKKSIWFQNQYILDKDISNSLAAAAKKGVKVKVVVTSLCAYGEPSKHDAKRAALIYGPMDAAGVKTRFFTDRIKINGKPGYLHAKAIVIDDENAWVGSVNGSTLALSVNREFGVFFSGQDAVAPMASIIRSDFESQGSETREESVSCAKDVQLLDPSLED